MKLKQVLLSCIGFSAVYFILSLIMTILTSSLFYMALSWNLFLALLPLILANLIKDSISMKSVKTLIWAFIWLIFLPNSFYTVTDFIHLSKFTFYTELNGTIINYTENIIIWITFIFIASLTFLGTLMGLLSLYVIHKILITKKVKYVNLIIVIISLLNGIAIYIGRFLRFNSWDILKPLTLVTELALSINLFSALFIVGFTCYILFIYAIFYIFFEIKLNNKMV